MQQPTPGHHYKAYSQATHTVAKTRQVVMLYDGAIRFLSQAREAMEKADYERRYNTLSKAGEILVGLQACLDFDAGEKTAQTLFDFYSSLDLRILQLHRTNDVAECARVIADLKQMREVWNGIDRGDSAAHTPSAAVAAPVEAGAKPVTVSA